MKLLKWFVFLKIRKKQTWILVLLFCIVNILLIHNIEDKILQRNFATEYATDSFLYLSQVNKVDSLTDKDKENNPKLEFSYQLFDDVRDEIWRLSYSENYREMNRLLSMMSILQLMEYYSGEQSDLSIDQNVLPVWNSVSEGVAFEDVDFSSKLRGEGALPVNLYILMAQYHNYLYKNDFKMLFNDEVSNLSYLYNWMDIILPIALITLSILLSYNTINDSVQDGKIKLLISSGVDRKKIYFSAWISNLIHIVFIIILAVLIVCAYVNINSETYSMNYPMIILSDPLTNLNSIDNYYDMANEIGRLGEIHPNSLGRIPPLNEYFSLGGDIHNRVEVVPFYQLMNLSFFISIAFIAFASALTVFLSTIFKNGIVTLIISISTFVGGYLMTTQLTKLNNINFSPFTMFQPIRIVEGVYNTTFLNSIIVLTLSTILLLITGNIVFSRKNL